MAGLSTLHAGRAVTAQLHLELHHVPGILGQLRHIVHDLNLTVEHEQRVVHIGNAAHNLGLHHDLIVLDGQESHLGTALLIEQIAKEVNRP